jgi:hypothetical protein
MQTCNKAKPAHAFLMEDQNMKKWVGKTIPEVSLVRVLVDDRLSSIAGEN